jgi:hypothetical protein
MSYSKDSSHWQYQLNDILDYVIEAPWKLQPHLDQKFSEDDDTPLHAMSCLEQGKEMRAT